MRARRRFLGIGGTATAEEDAEEGEEAMDEAGERLIEGEEDEDEDEDEDEEEDSDDENGDDENEDDDGDDDGAGEDDDEEASGEEASGEEASGEAGDADGAAVEPALDSHLVVPRLVFDSAVEALPADGALRLRCLRMCWQFEESIQLQRHIERSIRAGFPADPEMATSLARTFLERLGTAKQDGWTPKHTRALERGLQSFGASERGVTSSPQGSEGMVDAYTGWLEELQRLPHLPQPMHLRLHRQLVESSRNAHKARTATAAVYLRWAVWQLVRTPQMLPPMPPLTQLACEREHFRRIDLTRLCDGQETRALAAALATCAKGVKRCPADATLACFHAQLVHSTLGAPPSPRALAELRAVIEAAVSRLDAKVAAPMWLLWLELTLEVAGDEGAGQKLTAEDLMALANELFILYKHGGVALQHHGTPFKVRSHPLTPPLTPAPPPTPTPATTTPFKVRLVERLCERLSLEQCTKVRSRLLELPSTPLGVFERLLMQEEAARKGAPRAETRELFERALAEHGSSAAGLWARYAAWHLQHEDFAAASRVHRRALRALSEDDAVAFAAAFDAQRSQLGPKGE